MRPRYPHIEVTLDISGPDGNAFAIMSVVTRALARNGAPQSEIDKYREESMLGDYENLIAVTRHWVKFQIGRLVMVPLDDHDYSPTPEQQLDEDILSDMEEIKKEMERD